MQHAAVCVEARPATAVADANATSPESSLPMLTESFELYNSRKAVSDDALAECFSDSNAVVYGTLSHSHMTLCLRAFKAGAKWNIAGEEQRGFKIHDDSGRLSVSAVADIAYCSELTEILNVGALFEVLSWKMDVEQPDAASIISHALNSAQEIAMQQTEQQALQVLHGMAIPQNAGAAQGLAFSTVQEKARAHLGHVVDDLEFVDLYEYCSNLGMAKSPFLQDLLQYMSTFVDSKKRRLRFSAFAEANKLGLEFPRMKVALIKACYRRKPTNGICANPSGLWATATERQVRLQDGEQVLHYVHVTAAKTMQKLVPKSRNVLLANVDVAVVTAYESMQKNETKAQDVVRPKLVAAAAKHMSAWFEILALAKLATFVPNADQDADWVREAFLAEYENFERDKKNAEPAEVVPVPAKRQAAEVHVPTAAEFDEASGKMLKAPEGSTLPIAQPELKKQKTGQQLVSIPVDWAYAQGLASSKGDQLSGPDAQASAAVAAVMQHLFMQQVDSSQVPSDQDENSAMRQNVSIHAEGGGRSKVISLADRNNGELKLFPVVQAANRIVAATNHPSAVPIHVTMFMGNKIVSDEKGGGGDGNKPSGSGKAKKPKAGAAKKADEGGGASAAVAAESEKTPDAGAVRKSIVYLLPEFKPPVLQEQELKWHGDEKVHPFWAVRRITSEQLAAENEAQPTGEGIAKKPARFNCKIDAKECTLVSLNGGATCTWKIMVPIMTNHEELTYSEELLLQTFPLKKKTTNINKTQHWTKAAKIQ